MVVDMCNATGEDTRLTSKVMVNGAGEVTRLVTVDMDSAMEAVFAKGLISNMTVVWATNHTDPKDDTDQRIRESDFKPDRAIREELPRMPKYQW
jgi:hypothetical protein